MSVDEPLELTEAQEISLENLTYGCVEEILARALKYVQETQCPCCNAYIDPDSSSIEQCQNCETLVDELVGCIIETAKENLMAESGRNYVFNEYDEPKDITWFSIDQYSTDMALKKIDQYIKVKLYICFSFYEELPLLVPVVSCSVEQNLHVLNLLIKCNLDIFHL